MKRILPAVLLVLVSVAHSSRMSARATENRVTGGELIVDPPTLINLGFEWIITGDDNRNAAVEVRFRKMGDTAWKPALPLLRLQGEEIYNGAQLNVVAPNMFAGSILDLEPDTAYECGFTLSDPDGGNATRTVTVRTRPEPKPFEGGRVFHVYPHGFKGQKQEPSYEGLLCAYHLPGGSTRLTSGSAGVLFYNNTILSETTAQVTSNVHWRNNLFLGENTTPAIFSINTFTNYSSSDYNGFRVNPGAEYSFQWNSPPPSVMSDYTGPGHQATLQTRRFANLKEYSQATHQDEHSVSIDYDIFVNVPKLDRADLKSVQKVYKAEDYDFRLKPNSAAVDRGVALPNVNEGFKGRAPDLGALESGNPAPHFGPR